MTETTEHQAVDFEQPRFSMSVVANQKSYQWTNSQAFYSMLPGAYQGFYNNWVRQWLYWYDGYVPYIHGGQRGLLSTGIGTTIVNRCADIVFGGALMFANKRKPKFTQLNEKGKEVGTALDFISNKFDCMADLRGVIKKAVKNAFAGGFSLLKINKYAGDLWIDTLRADRFFFEKTSKGELRKVVSIIAFYEDTTRKDGRRFGLIEERRYERIGMFGQEIPVVEYKMYQTSSQIQYLAAGDNSLRWEDIPKNVRLAFKADYDFEINKPQHMSGFENLGCYILTGSDEVSNVPQFGMGESVLANIMTYLYEYDFYNTCFNTDMYLARGRVLVPKPMQNPARTSAGQQPSGLDDFIYTKYESPNNDDMKPESIQFQLRAAEWKEARNMLLECIATSIGLSVSTLASYLSDGSNRTAREVSAEENATTLFMENARRRFEKPLNDMIDDILHFYGYVDDVEVRWSRAGMTNQTVLVDTLARAVQAKLISCEKAHEAYNYDDDEAQNAEDWKKIQDEQKAQTMQYNDSDYFGGGRF